MHFVVPFSVADHEVKLSKEVGLKFELLKVLVFQLWENHLENGSRLYFLARDLLNLILQKEGRKLRMKKRFWFLSRQQTLMISLNLPLASHPTTYTTHQNERNLVLENKEAADIPHDGEISLPGSQAADSQDFTPQDEPYDPEKIRLEQAATKDAGCFQGLFGPPSISGSQRHNKVAGSHSGTPERLGIPDIGLEVNRKCNLVKLLEGKPVKSVGVNLSIRMRKLSTNAFVSKEPNSVSNWLKRWSASQFWKPAPQPKKASGSKTQKKQVNSQTIDAETGRPKRSVRRVPATNAENISLQSTPEFEKSKRSLKKVSSHQADPVHENPQNELEKVKRSLRKVHSPVVETSVSVQSEFEFEKPKVSMEKVSETTPEPVEMKETSDLPSGDQIVVESKPLIDNGGKDETIPVPNGELNLKDDLVNNENHKPSRKASTPAKQERAENGLQNSPTLPSYMAATESAKAKLRLQGSPRSGQDGADRISATRRQSLPSSTNSKISSQSPRTQRPVNAGSKGGHKGDKNHSSSKDGNAKVSQEWKR
ncbi:hypothetical protein Patl1_17832 [Pistacia atlantica]|uniref:Uncharacterized protein n=1 Tax=Pistacia atlantica TaxID=434234 RepID=A0ACC1C018_9ROSI|nr:hypothetical protein Patl1_17832 [Pistacia atlantica]